MPGGTESNCTGIGEFPSFVLELHCGVDFFSICIWFRNW